MLRSLFFTLKILFKLNTLVRKDSLMGFKFTALILLNENNYCSMREKREKFKPKLQDVYAGYFILLKSLIVPLIHAFHKEYMVLYYLKIFKH